jgi:hypothetical protein
MVGSVVAGLAAVFLGIGVAQSITPAAPMSAARNLPRVKRLAIVQRPPQVERPDQGSSP